MVSGSDITGDQRDEGYSILLCLKKLDYQRSHNPRYVWEAIRMLKNEQRQDYPIWVREYLEQTAINLLEKCDRTAAGNNGLIPCLGFDRLSQLYEPDSDDICEIYQMMEEKTSKGISISKAAEEVERERWDPKLNKEGIEQDTKGKSQKTRGYWGAHKIRKIYSEVKKVERETWLESLENDW
ncbi:MAG: hypothetical protein H8E79_01670 [Desulfobulbaceae bacterium]|uniref:Uncharacterized protein n=1 Tax=Candidatus Desulfatifera sulfidica TaxID=2841691 RepID=A0A8J6T8V7_9BACT|nr:hypothetical protein [Candidatus Desulfatifera sulfidica]